MMLKPWPPPGYAPVYHVTYVVLEMLPWQPSWISEWNVSSNSESPCSPDVSRQVSVKSNMVWEEIMQPWPPSCISKKNEFSKSEISKLPQRLPQSFCSTQHYVQG